MTVKLTEQPDGSLLLAVKVVPGASRDRIVGPLGASLKIATTAPPQGGQANAAVCRLLAERLGVPARDVTVHAGGGTPFKTLRLVGLTAHQARQKLALPGGLGR